MAGSDETKELDGAFRAAADARAFWERNANSLITQYENQWVAIRDGKVVASAPNAEALLKALEEKRLADQDLLIRFVHGPEVDFAF